jgi:hypothetical protein
MLLLKLIPPFTGSHKSESIMLMEKTTLEKEVLKDDPWQMLDTILDSNHCKGKKSRIISYDHTGAVYARCDCGKDYWHDHGAWVSPEKTCPFN